MGSVMNQSELDAALLQLKEDLKNRINSHGMLQSIINKHIKMINSCIDQNVTISIIHNYIFPDKDITILHFKNLIYRARKKNTRNNINNSRRASTENSYNSLSFLSKDSKPIHNNSSDEEAANQRLKLLMQQKNKA